MSFDEQKLGLILSIFFPLWLFFSCVLCNKSLFITYLHMSFPKTIVVLALMFRLVIHFRLIHVWDKDRGSFFSMWLFTWHTAVVSAPFVEKAVSPLLNYFSTFVKNVIWPYECWSVFPLSVLFHQYLFISLCQYHTILIL